MQVNKTFKIISWPTKARQQEISRHLGCAGFPGIIGCVDGSHIEIIAPKTYPNSYINRKSYHSVLLQGVCDQKLLFTNVYTGEAGSIHDYTLYRSDLFAKIISGEVAFYEDSHLVADLAYKLASNLTS